MTGELKRYYTYEDLASRLNTNYMTIKALLKGFRIDHSKHNGRQCVRYEDFLYLQDCQRLQKASRMKYTYIKTLPKKVIKDLIDRL